ARRAHLIRVDDDDEVARIDVGRILRLVLAPQHRRHLARQPAQGLTLGVDDVPLALHTARLRHEGPTHRLELLPGSGPFPSRKEPRPNSILIQGFSRVNRIPRAPATARGPAPWAPPLLAAARPAPPPPTPAGAAPAPPGGRRPGPPGSSGPAILRPRR